MIGHLKDFLRYLSLNRNLSPHTVRAYGSDLRQWLDLTAAAHGVRVSALPPSALNRQAVRAFLAAGHDAGQSRATAARKLAAIRTFLRYLRREGVHDDDAAAQVPTPARDIRMPAHLTESEMGALLDAPLYDMAYAERLLVLLKNRIGLWDVLHRCDRAGALDSNIRNAVSNDFRRVTRVAPGLKRVCFNGKTAGRFEPVFADEIGRAHV